MESEFLNYLDVFQICDSTFPIGSFNHSFGMENYLYNKTIKKNDDFSIWFNNFFNTQFKHGEGLLIKLVYESSGTHNLKKILFYDDVITKSSLAKETRDGNKLIAKQLINILEVLYKNKIPMLDKYRNIVLKKEAYGNPAIVFALFSLYKKLSLEEAIFMYSYSVGATIVQNAVRSIPIGQKEGQIILKNLTVSLPNLISQIMKLDEDTLGANTPGIEIAQIRHESQSFRLFMS
ncbi:TPA: urease accessory UreF family protein [Enterococcus hirae]|uniref:urease accessory protein UreF n=1 Tax=Enterococcus hirae TaxID=1354 RepID=UPI0027CA567F|nr:urease accessory UreF family protein [Enterococcus hirae]MDQ2183110.1 urease accessory protein UreF [Enterococcus hirae]